jgi:cyclopropane fatty-acyl-phospholipid synthase-like methyltransferase
MDSQARFERTFTGPASAVRARIWQQVYGPEYPAWADPFSYISLTELRRFTHQLHAAPGQCLVDAGCGHGGPGLWVAAVTGGEWMLPH